MEAELLIRQQALPLHAAGGSKGTMGVAVVAGVALSCKTACRIPAPDFLLEFTPLASPRTDRPQGSSGVVS